MQPTSTQQTSNRTDATVAHPSGSEAGFLRDTHTTQRTSKMGLWNRFLGWTARWPLLSGFRCELRSFLGRMAEVRKLRLYALETDRGLGGQWSQIESPMGDRLILNRIADTQRIMAERPWVSISDVKMFLCGWDKGAEWGLSEMDIAGPGSEQESLKQVP